MLKPIGAIAALALTAALVGCGERGADPSAGGLAGSTTTAPEAAGGAGGAGDWGDLEGVCGPAEGGGAVPSGDDSQGVTEDAIVVGTVADPGFAARPGLNQELFDAGDAFVAWCNEAGGINGKALELNKHDAKLTDYAPAVEAACTTDFALVGGGAVQDNLWESTGAACDLIDIAGFAVTPEKAGLSGQAPEETRTVQSLPNPGDQYVVAGPRLIDAEHPGARDATAFLYADFQTLKAQYEKEAQAFAAAGHTEVSQGVYGINGEANWKPFATTMQNRDVRFVKFIGEGSHAAGLEQAMDQVGFEPEVRYYEGNFYDPAFVEAAGPAADGAFIGSVFIPLEEADTHPATQQYIDVLEAQGGKQAVLGMQSMSAWLLFATLARDCDRADDLTRTCILEGAGEVSEWTGGGLHAPTDPGENRASPCQMVIRIEDGEFTRWAPTDEDFSCSEDAIVDVEPAG